jgi:pimeloyl-ACP methyl ester carboxylesterase
VTRSTSSGEPGLFGAARPLQLTDQGCFFTGGTYADDGSDTMAGHMFVQYQVPAELSHPYPIVMIHGGGQTGVGFLSTPDGREGWADYFVSTGFSVFVVDLPGRGRAQGHESAADGARRPAHTVAARVSDDTAQRPWPQARRHTQWPAGSVPGQTTFDQFYASQVSGTADVGRMEQEARHAGAQLLDRIGPVVLLTHSLGALVGWHLADARPELVRAVVAVEPNGPPVYDIRYTSDAVWYADGGLARPWGLTRSPLTYSPPAVSAEELTFVRQAAPDSPELARCWLQAEPARQLPNLARVRIMIASGEASYHSPYDHGTSAYLTQAGVEHDFIRLADHGIRGNGHMMMLEKNNLEIAAFIRRWITATP